MNSLHRCGVFLIVAMFWLGLFSSHAYCEGSSELAARRVIAFLHAAVIPMDRERALRDQTVLVADGKIVSIGPTSIVKVPAGALRIDAKGRYLIPALCDMHVHLLGEAWNIMMPPDAQLASKDIPFENFLFPYVANGVTTVQELFAKPEQLGLRQRRLRPLSLHRLDEQIEIVGTEVLASSISFSLFFKYTSRPFS